MNRRSPPAPARHRGSRTGASSAVGQALPRHGIARILSKLGVCSRTEAARWVEAGRVAIDGRVVRDPEFPVVQDPGVAGRIHVDGQAIAGAQRICLMLNKPRGLVTSVRDERGRDTVYRCLEGADLPWLAPVGRLDKASEGLLLFTNDPQWAAAVTDPQQGPDKTYHVQVDRLPDEAELQRLRAGVPVDGEILGVARVAVLRRGERHTWLEIVLDEGRNRQIRRLLSELDIGVLRLLRVAIGGLPLGDLPKGQWRLLSEDEQRQLVPDRHRR